MSKSKKNFQILKLKKHTFKREYFYYVIASQKKRRKIVELVFKLKNKIYNYINMDNLIKIFGRNFIYGGLILGFCLTLIDLIKNSSNNIALYAFLSGSFYSKFISILLCE